MSARREFALSELLPKLEISNIERPISLAQVLTKDFAIIDFGCGMGTHTLNLAQQNPKVGILAIDVHTVGLLSIAESVAELGLTNIRTHHGDGMEVMKDWLEPESIDEVHILFPDPWPKARHHKRRLIKEAFLCEVLICLKPGGKIVFVTDDESYFESANQVFGSIKDLQVSLNDWEVPATAYHLRALRLKHKIQQLSAQKL
jgi:tRNA (guanine-N7-)-methyltransferase